MKRIGLRSVQGIVHLRYDVVIKGVKRQLTLFRIFTLLQLLLHGVLRFGTPRLTTGISQVPSREKGSGVG